MGLGVSGEVYMVVLQVNACYNKANCLVLWRGYKT